MGNPCKGPYCQTDFFRDTWVRYLGYANEVGESFRPVVPRSVVRASYGVAMLYVIADTAHKSQASLRRDGRLSKMIVDAGDALIWQTLASVIIPGVVINRISHYSGKGLAKYFGKIPRSTRKWMTVAIGLSSIPFIVKPIDTAVTAFMDISYRKVF
ncbi:mitochondrial fission process protein 1 [Hyposmocoma kahamanoa]|uniref:mitochondrial fission process protein 1 n=1 Tax=Hyposmocoma kahamanoa TaxID=1477025 RepID=UPI000E6D6991|nr:mitochondrial fission process protein 1 [Hyposmocoma kahamanoa]